jgi:hypothetical protein
MGRMALRPEPSAEIPDHSSFCRLDTMEFGAEWLLGDSSLNSTIPELPGSGWLAAEPEATPQTHRLRPWGFPTCHPT